MSEEENYLDNLLKALTEPKEVESTKKVHSDDTDEEAMLEEKETKELSDNEHIEEVIIPIESDALTHTVEADKMELVSEETLIPDEVLELDEISNIADLELPDMNFDSFDLEDTQLPEELLQAEHFTEISNESTLDDLEIDLNQEIDQSLADQLDTVSDQDIDRTAQEEDNFESDPLSAEYEDLQVESTQMLDEEISKDVGVQNEDTFAQQEQEELDILKESMTDSMSKEDRGDMEMADIPDEMNIEELGEAIQSETELQMANELKEDELGLEAQMQEESENNTIQGATIEDDLGMLDGMSAENILPDEDDDSLEDVLSMLDNDAELAEINDMLKKSDNNEPIEDDMMSLLHQMADDEAASVNAGQSHLLDEEEDDGVPLPVPPASALNPEPQPTEHVKSDEKKKKEKPKKSKKIQETEEEQDEPVAKKPGKLAKFFNMLTEDLVPEPTEEELAAEREAKKAKKQENLTKKEQEKLAKAEEKKAKAEAKEVEKKAKAEEAQKKSKEKKEERAKKAAAKKAKREAEAPKNVIRVSPKKTAAVTVFGISVGGAIILSANILSAQGYLQSARNAYSSQDYKTVYQATYGMNLDTSESDGLIQAKSEVILKMQRRYDSYQAYLKMGREIEALDALLQGITTYDYINADAQMYGVEAEVDAIKTEILNVLSVKYGLDEAAARELIANEDPLSYTIALSDIIDNQ